MTRWAMNFLAGPLTRTQIPGLNQLVGAMAIPSDSPLPQKEPVPQSEPLSSLQAVPVPPLAESTPGLIPASSSLGSETRPAVPTGIAEYFLPHTLTLSQAAKAASRTLPQDSVVQGLLYRPVLLAQASVRFLQRKYNLDHESHRTAIVLEPDRRGSARWEDWLAASLDPAILEREAAPGGTFAALEAPFNDGKLLRALNTDFNDWAYRTTEVSVRANETLKVYTGPEVSQAEFRRECAEAARQARDDEIAKVEGQYEKKIDTLHTRLRREERELSQDEIDLSQRKMEEMGTHAENVLSLFSGRSRRRLSTSLSKRRMTEQAKARVEESVDAIDDYESQIAALEKEMAQAIEDIKARWVEIADDMTQIPIKPYKKDVLVELFGVAWMPYLVVDTGGQTWELPGFGTNL
jgi:hypothetical protein